MYRVADAAHHPTADELELSNKRAACPRTLARHEAELAIACGLLHSPGDLFRRTAHGPGSVWHPEDEDSILKRARDGAAIIISSHLLHLVQEICSRLLIQRGELVAIGTIAKIVAGQPQLAGQGLEDILPALTGGGRDG